MDDGREARMTSQSRSGSIFATSSSFQSSSSAAKKVRFNRSRSCVTFPSLSLSLASAFHAFASPRFRFPSLSLTLASAFPLSLSLASLSLCRFFPLSFALALILRSVRQIGRGGQGYYLHLGGLIAVQANRSKGPKVLHPKLFLLDVDLGEREGRGGKRGTYE